MRCTPPMKAPWPPPTMPMRNLRFQESMMFSSCNYNFNLTQSENAPVRFYIRLAAREIIEGYIRGLDDVTGNKGGAFSCALFRALDAALPLQHRPAVVSSLGEKGKDA